ncbi:MAG: domain containing protein [Pedosphaera sp.]|nr:domain containing protein [Pedosphaera sp.]
MAATYLGEFGPSAAAGIPALTHALKEGHDGNAATSLGKIHGQPEVIIPLLMTYLDDEDLADEMAEALGNFGPLAKAAVPKLLPLLKARDRDTRQAAIVALKQIDPEALTNALAAAQDRPKPAK